MSEQNGPQRTKDDACAVAKRMKLECFFPEDDEIFLDLDEAKDPDKPSLNAQVLNILSTAMGVVEHLTTISKSGKAKHMYIRVRRSLSPAERIAWQVCLGSDPIKEALSLKRLIENSEADTALFETPEQAQKVINWREERMPF